MIPKFRAYLKDIKQIADVDAILFENIVAKVSNNEFHHLDDLILMQSTGLYDKNGVEIFEGDIVNLNTTFRNPMTGCDNLTLDKNFEVVLERGAFRMKGHSIIDRYLDELEVIGNVHQHPELLEDV